MEMAEEITVDCGLWGEIGTQLPSSPPCSQDVFNNVEQDVIIHSIQNISFKKHFCNQNEPRSSQINRENEIKLDDPMKHTVKLLKYKNDLKSVMDHNKLQPGLFDIEEQLKNIKPPRIEKKKERSKIIFLKHLNSNFVNGLYSELPMNITEESALTVLRNSVITVLAFVGFTETKIMPLQVLTEVTENYIITLLKLLRLNVEKERIHGESGFCDIVDRTFHEMGVGSVRNLVTYYQDCVLNLKTKKVKSCREELVSYEDSVQKLKEEKKQHILQSSFQDMDDGNLVIPELHVTSIAGNDLLSESFETSMQMLQTLERQQFKSEPSSEASINEIGDLKGLKRKRKL